jgi:hypothetical protein
MQGVLKPLDSVGRIRLKEQGPPAVEGELGGDRDTPRRWVFQRLHEVRQLTYLTAAALNGLSAKRGLRRQRVHRATRVLNRPVQCGCDAMPCAAVQEVIGPQPMRVGRRRANPGGQIIVEVRGLEDGEDASE